MHVWVLVEEALHQFGFVSREVSRIELPSAAYCDYAVSIGP
jgi:hypothetical protein